MDEIFEQKRHPKYCSMGNVGGPKSSRCTGGAVLSAQLSSISTPATVCVAAVRSFCSCAESTSGGEQGKGGCESMDSMDCYVRLWEGTLNSVHATRL